MNDKLLDDKKHYLENILVELEKKDEYLNKLIIESKMKRNHNLAKLKDIRDLGGNMNWKDDTGLLEQINSLFQ